MNDHYFQYDKHHKSHRRLKKFKWFFIGGAIAAVLAVPAFIIYTAFFTTQESVPVVSSTQRSVQASTSRVFRSPYFQFQASGKWAEDAEASTDSVFIYKAFNGPLVEHDIAIHVNPDLAAGDFEATHVQSVTVNDNQTLIISDPISPHCRELLEKGQVRIVRTVVDEVDMLCDSNHSIYSVVVGEKGGSYALSMERPDGTIASYVIYYRDLTASPTGRELKNIVETFQAR